MKTNLKIFIALILIFTIHPAFAQVPDSASIKQDKKTTEMNQVNNGNDNNNQAQQGDNKQNENTTIKQLKGARPDMSKSRGARPPYIERQAGSGIPRGIGKPGGAAGIKPGKR